MTTKLNNHRGSVALIVVGVVAAVALLGVGYYLSQNRQYSAGQTTTNYSQTAIPAIVQSDTDGAAVMKAVQADEAINLDDSNVSDSDLD